MPSESLSPQEAKDLLHKLITESTRIQGAFVSAVSGVGAVVWGVIRVSLTGLLNIVEREDDTPSPIICFVPSRAVLPVRCHNLCALPWLCAFFQSPKLRMKPSTRR